MNKIWGINVSNLCVLLKCLLHKYNIVVNKSYCGTYAGYVFSKVEVGTANIKKLPGPDSFLKRL